MISAKKIRKFAESYLTSSSWDEKRDIIRQIYTESLKENRKTNLSYFAKLVKKDFKEIYEQGQLEIYNIQLRQQKYKQNVSFQTVKKNLERKKNPKKRKHNTNIQAVFNAQINVQNSQKTGQKGGKYSKHDAQVYSSIFNQK